MKVLILASFLCFVSANLMRRAAPAVDDSVIAFLHGSSSTRSLSETLRVKEKWLDKAEDDIQSGLGNHLKDALNELLKKIKVNVDHAKQVGQNLHEMAKEIKEKLKDMGVEVGSKSKELVQQIKAKTKGTLRKILDQLGLGKCNMDEQLDRTARSQFNYLIDEIIERVTSNENVQKIKEFIKNITANSKLAQALKNIVQKLPDEELKDLIRNLLAIRAKNQSEKARGEIWDKIKTNLDFDIEIGRQSKKFRKWVEETWSEGKNKLQEKYRKIKAIAMEFISNGKDVSAEVAREALEFFRPYKNDLGSTWDKLVEVAKQAIGQFPLSK